MRFYKHVWFWVLVAVVLGGAGAYFAFGWNASEQEIVTALVKKGNLVQTVEASGVVESNREVELSFEVSGIVEEILVEEGDEVKAGEVIMTLHSSDALYNLSKAQATVAAAEANINQELAGESDESIGVSKAQLNESGALLKKYETDLVNAEEDLKNTTELYAAATEKARANLETEEDNLKNTLADNEQDLIEVYDDAISVMKAAVITAAGALTEADNVLGIDNTNANTEFEYLLSILNEQYMLDAKLSYPVARDKMLDVEELLEDITIDSEDEEIDAAIEEVRVMLDLVSETLNDTRHVLDATISGTSDLTQSELNTMKSTIDTERTAVNTAQTNLINQEQLIESTQITAQTAEDAARDAYDIALKTLEEAEATESAKVALAEAALRTAEVQLAVQQASVATSEASLALKQAQPRTVDMAVLYAQADEAYAALALAESEYAKYQITAPFDGQVTDINFEIGEMVTAGTASAAMLALGEFEVIANIDESDIVKVELGDKAEITFDAFGDDVVFDGWVSKMNPSEKIIEGVVLYEVTVQLDELSEQIRSGMSADITVFTEELEEVLIVPNRAILTENMVKYVRILEDGEVRHREVVVGVRGDGGNTQIVNGVSEGEEVIITIRDKK